MITLEKYIDTEAEIQSKINELECEKTDLRSEYITKMRAIEDKQEKLMIEIRKYR